MNRRSAEAFARVRHRSAGSGFSAVFAVWACSTLLVLVGCGKKGPPLPPLLKVPVAPPDLVASRRGDVVDLQFTVPTTNTDGTRPANIERVDIYALTMAPGAPPEALTDAQIAKVGTRIDTVECGTHSPGA